MLVVSRYLWALLGVRRLGKIEIMIMAMSMREFDLLFTCLLLDNKIIIYHCIFSCYLNPTSSFVWSLILPVILILLANIGFFVMTLVIKYKNQNGIKQHKDKFKQVW